MLAAFPATAISRGMSPEEFARRIPQLFHVTDQGAWPLIERHGLLSANTLIDRFAPERERERLKGTRRTEPLTLHEAEGERAMLNDNKPLHFPLLAPTLRDGLTPEAWLRLLNGRVFLWPRLERGSGFLDAGRRGGREKLLLTFDALRFARAHHERIDIAPINTGSATRKPTPRGHAIFTPIAQTTWSEWRQLRAPEKRTPDTVAEVSVRGDVPDAVALLSRDPEPI